MHFEKEGIMNQEKEKDDLDLNRHKNLDELKEKLKDIQAMNQYIKNCKSCEGFELLDYVGYGAKSVIYRISMINKKSPQQKENAIMKLILSKKRNNKELNISSKLKNKNIINYYGHSTLKENESTMLFIEPAKYNNLRVFQTTTLKRQILSESFLNFIAYQILNGLAYLHRCKIAHMDLKPQNLVINEYLEVKIIDFSNSIDYRHTKNDKIKLPFCGTNFYLPKEVIKEERIKVKDLNKIDLYALGVILYNLAFGKYPYGLKNGDENNYKEILRKIENEELEMDKKMEYSPLFLDFLNKLLKKDINERMNINNALNHYWVKGSKLLLDEKEKCEITSNFLRYLLENHIKKFNDYVRAESLNLCYI